jgi:fumarate reductase flavoprotein subunit
MNGCTYDAIVIGGGTAGLTTAIFAVQKGARVLVLEVAPQIRGSLYVSGGQMSAAGTRMQASLGISDSPSRHYEDVMRISGGTANAELVSLATAKVDWFMAHGFVPAKDTPVRGVDHEPYSERRYVWGPENGISILTVLKSLVEPLFETGRAGLEVSVRVTELLERDGAIVGVRAEDSKGEARNYFGTRIILTTGGYTSNPKLCFQLDGVEQYGLLSYAYSQGTAS